MNDQAMTLLPTIICVFGAIFMMMASAFTNLTSKKAGIISAAIFLVAAAVQFSCLHIETTPFPELFKYMLRTDTVSSFLSFIVLLCGAAISLFSANYFLEKKDYKTEIYAMLFFAATGMMIIFISQELISIFIGLETMSIPIYVLVGICKRRVQTAEAMFKYLLLGAFAGALYVMGSAFIYGQTSSTLLDIAQATLTTGITDKPLMIIGLIFITSALLFKIAAFPFHAWSLDVYQGAANPITGLMASSVKLTAFALIFKILLGVYGPVANFWVEAISIAAVASMIAGNFLAIIQKNIKRMLAASGIVHTGYLLAGLVAASSVGIASAKPILFYLLAYTVATVGVFGIISLVQVGNDSYDALNGLGRQRPFFAAVLTLFLLSMLGLPTTIGFLGKFELFTFMIESGFAWLAVMSIISSIFSIAYYLRPIVNMYFNNEENDLINSGKLIYGTSALLAVIVIIGGITGVLLKFVELI